MSSEILTGLIGAVLSILLGAVTFFVRLWINRVEDSLKDISAKVGHIDKHIAVAIEKNASFRGSLDTLRQSISDNGSHIGRISGSVEKLWHVTSKQADITRFSDK